MATVKANLFPYPADIKAWVAENVGWGGYYTVELDKANSRVKLGSVYGKNSRLVENIPTGVAAALSNLAQASIPTMDGTQQNFDKPALDSVTFELAEPTLPPNMAPDPSLYPANDRGKRQYLADYGRHLEATRKPHEDAAPPSLKRWG